MQKFKLIKVKNTQGLYTYYDKYKNKHYYARIRVLNKQVTCNLTKKYNATNLTQAKIALQQFRQEQIKAIKKESDRHTISLDDFFEQYYIVTKREGNYKKMLLSMYKTHIRKKIGYKYLQDITLGDIDYVISTIDRKDGTKLFVKQLLRNLFNIAIEQGFIKHNVVKSYKIDGQADNRIIQNTKKDIVEILQGQDILYFAKTLFNILLSKYKETSDKTYLYFLTLMLTGRRRNEILQLKYKDITNNIAKVEHTHTKSKTTQNYYIVYFLIKEFEKIRTDKRVKDVKIFEGLTRAKADYRFKKLKEDIEEINMKNFTIHSFRHLLATICYNFLNTDMHVIERILGHVYKENRAVFIYTTIKLDKQKKALEDYYKLLTS